MLLDFEKIMAQNNAYKYKNITDECPCSRCGIGEERRRLVESHVESHAREECTKCGKCAAWLIECVKKVTWIEENSKIRKGCRGWDGCDGCVQEESKVDEWPCTYCRRRYADYYMPK